MIAYLLEPFLVQFYLLEAVCGNFMTEKEKSKLFHELAKVFCLSEEPELKTYYALSNEEQFREIMDYASYERFCRMVEFAQKNGQDARLTEEDQRVLAQKREAMYIKETLFRQDKNLTQERIATVLLNMAMQGNVDAMSTMAYLEYHGICVCKDRKNAMKRIRLCAKWNNLFGNLMGIAYDGENAKRYYDTLHTILQNASQKRLFHHVCRFTDYDETSQRNPVAKILEKAFGLNIVKRNVYDHAFAQVAFSKLISVEDKEKILLNRQKEALFSLSDIPFDVFEQTGATFEHTCFKGAPLKRTEEFKKIQQNLTIAMECPELSYRPLMIVASDDEYMTEMYEALLRKGFAQFPIVELDASMLAGTDFSAGKENIFLRSLSETKCMRTVFFIQHCDKLEQNQLWELMKMLDNEYRRKFKLMQPTVSLDLSGLLFVLFAGEKNTPVVELSACCDTVWAARIGSEEKYVVIDDMFATRASVYGRKALKLEEGGRAFLATYDTRQVLRIVDGAIRSAIFEKKEVVTVEALKEICRQEHISATRREFGYVGGTRYAEN